MPVKKTFFSFIFALTFLFTFVVSAATLEFPDYLSTEQTIGDDVYMIGETITIKGKVIGDLLSIGKTISSTGAVAADFLAMGLHIEAAGNINDDFRALGLQTDLRGNVGDDVVLAGFKVHISPDSRIGHTAIVAAGQSIINGHVQGDVIVTGYDCILGGSIQGNVTASVAKLQLSPTTHIKGSLLYSSQDPVIIPPGAVIEGEIIHQQPTSPTHMFFFPLEGSRQWVKLIGMVTWDAGLIMVGICLLLLLPQTIQISSRTMTSKPWLACLYGFLWLVGAPVTASLGIVTIVGLPLSIAIAFLYVSSLYLSSLPVAFWIGQKIFRTQAKPYLSLITGVLVISLLRSLPYVGFIIGTIILTVGLGSLALSFREYILDAGKNF